jgi:GNAT superfamily N-acetyltransferase
VALRLRRLRDDELPAFIEHTRAAYEGDLVAQGGLRPAEAAQKTLDDWSRLLPDGNVPPGNDLYAIEDVASSERFGDLWLAERDNNVREKTLFVYSIEIAPQHRGPGFGHEAMLLFEDEVRRRGLSQANVTVLGGKRGGEIALPLARLRRARGVHVQGSLGLGPRLLVHEAPSGGVARKVGPAERHPGSHRPQPAAIPLLR